MASDRAGPEKVDHYGSQYSNFRSGVLEQVRREIFGEDYGQNGWQTADELDHFIEGLSIGPGSRLLDVACGSGGPSLRVVEKTGCSVVGIDIHRDGIATARAMARERGLGDRATFQQIDATKSLPFDTGAFDAVLCVDAINHLADRPRVLADWLRILKPGGRLVYTDPIILSGWLSSVEMKIRSSVGFFLFFAPGINEKMLHAAGFEVVSVEDVTGNMASMADRWGKARRNHESELRQLEGDETFEGQQTFFEIAARVASQGRLSRHLFMARKR